MRGPIVALILSLMISAGCGTSSGGPELAKEGGSGGIDLSATPRLETADGLVKAEIDMPGVLFIREGHGIGSYDALLIPQSNISYKNRTGRLPEELESQFLAMLEQTLVDAADDAEIPIDSYPGECVMQVAMSLVNVEIDPRRGDSLGEMTLVMEFRDTMSEAALLRYATKNWIEPAPEGTKPIDQVRESFEEMVAAMDISQAFGAAGLGDGIIREPCNGLLAQLGSGKRAAVSSGPP